jgi:hypothetical protein
MGRVAVALIVVGVVVFAWYAGWGVHGCDDYGGNSTCDRMDRDAVIYLAGLAALGIGLLIGIIPCARWLRARAARRHHPAGR